MLPSPSAAGGPPQLPRRRGQRLRGLLRAHGQQPGGWPASTWEQRVFREGSWLCSDREGSHVRSAGSKKGRGILPSPGEPQRVSEPRARQSEPSFFGADPDLARGGQSAGDRQKQGQAGPWRADGRKDGRTGYTDTTRLLPSFTSRTWSAGRLGFYVEVPWVKSVGYQQIIDWENFQS